MPQTSTVTTDSGQTLRGKGASAYQASDTAYERGATSAGAGGAAKGALSGLAAGAQFGPLGMAAGAIIGGVIGGAADSEAYKANYRAEKQAENAAERASQSAASDEAAAAKLSGGTPKMAYTPGIARAAGTSGVPAGTTSTMQFDRWLSR